MEIYIMGEVKDLLISGSSSEELRAMVDTARGQHNEGYIQFLEGQLEKAEKKIEWLKSVLRQEKGPGYCVECFKSLPGKESMCDSCQNELDVGYRKE